MLRRTALLLALLLAPASGAQTPDDRAVLAEIVQRRLDGVLEQEMERRGLDEPRREALRALLRARGLSDAATTLTASERRAVARRAVRAVEVAGDLIDEPHLQLQLASDLITGVIERDVNLLEFWGDNAATMAHLQPVASAALQLLRRAEAAATQAAERASADIAGPEDAARLAVYERLDLLARTAAYTRQMSAYYLALALDRADPQRRVLAQEAIAALRAYDVEDNPDRNLVRNRIAKLAMVAADYDLARDLFAAVAASDDPVVARQYEARCFAAIVELLARRPGEAQRRLALLQQWQEQALPPDPTVRAGAEAAMTMLRYRLLQLEADLAGDDAARARAGAEANALLETLLRDRPELRGVIFDQLASRIPPDAEPSALSALNLQALIRQGEDARLAEGAPDEQQQAHIRRAIAAARELAARDDAAVDAATRESARLVEAFLLEEIGEITPAAQAFLAIARTPGIAPRTADLSIEGARSTVGRLRRERPDDADAVRLYEGFLEAALAPPFERREFAYEYARRLHLQGRIDEALRVYALVPADDARALTARYYAAAARAQTLDSAAAARADLARLIAAEATAVVEEARRRLPDAPAPTQRRGLRLMLAGATLLRAEMLRAELGDPAGALGALDGFEDIAAGLDDEARRLADMLLIRVQALMALDRISEATDQLVLLVDREPQRGGQAVHQLLSRLNERLDAALGAGDSAGVATIARSRARLTGFLVRWASEHPNDAVRRLTYGYRVFDAEVRRFAATQEADAAARDAGLQEALAAFMALEGPDGAAQFRASAAADAPYDRAVMLGAARTLFDLRRYAEARERFARVLNDRALGLAVLVAEEEGVTTRRENDVYWEAVYKLIRCNLELGEHRDDARRYLSQQEIRWGEHVGGRLWRREFDALRATLGAAPAAGHAGGAD